ncbi:small integral membrane protein 29-like [Physella acuta]|uniref:small integral membrane protein 29-like n=1 Tax=Physella acuta TaxID=109671 RepID=UPI0027DD4221|nr:small integral membrane protein 29-like [Physella acuta]XP_059138951.1 small integral membrane protein 29-like [Physella acuta]
MSLLDSATTQSLFNETSSAVHQPGRKDSNFLLFILLPVTAIVCVGIAIGVIVWLLKRSRMDKLRNHLMPLYSFDPSDSGQDWETDLLSQEVRLRNSLTPPSSPILKLNTMHSEL